jgi:signal transduction histidine kinase
VALVAFVMAYIGLNRGLLVPLRSLTASIREVGEGNLDQKVPVLDEDELGTLALSFNQMAEQLKVYRANTSEELLRLNMTIRATLASFPDPIFVLNSQGAVEFRNPEADQLAIKLLFSGVTRLPEKVDKKVEEVRASGDDYLPTLFKDAIKFHVAGQDRYYLPRIVLLRNDARVAFGVAVILEDVTRMLLLDDIKSNLISTVSHELKTPLTSVRMALYLLFEKTVGGLNEKQMDLVSTARQDADRLLRTLNDLLDLAKLEQGPSQLQLARVSPREVVESAVRDAGEVAHAAGVKIETEIAPGLPEVEIDRQRVAYIFSNLITNAIKYGPPGQILRVRAEKGRDRADDARIRFSVRDQGPGIAPEYQEHIFERFYRVPGTEKSGAGLGLSIAREVVVAHQGEIGVITPPEGGSEFFFVLPFVSESK